MKVTITSGYESLDEEETLDLKVEGELSDKPNKVADVYLGLRKKLKEGIRKDIEKELERIQKQEIRKDTETEKKEEE